MDGKSQVRILEMIRPYWFQNLLVCQNLLVSDSALGVIPLTAGGNFAFWNDSGCTLWKGVLYVPSCDLSLNRSHVEVHLKRQNPGNYSYTAKHDLHKEQETNGMFLLLIFKPA